MVIFCGQILMSWEGPRATLLKLIKKAIKNKLKTALKNDELEINH
jgi:hypothetical protein